jgi:tetratricopeptide (TPR) repeat protein/anti-sigma regulatory factor (Ser/Thr protein kinase)
MVVKRAGFIVSLFLFLYTVNAGAQQQHAAKVKIADSIAVLISHDKEDTIKVRHLNDLSRAWQVVGDISRAMESANDAVSLSEKLGDKKNIANSNNQLGAVYYSSGSYPEALEFNLKALGLFEVLGDKAGEASAYSNIGNVYKEQANYPQALDNYQKALVINTEIGRKHGIAATNSNIGVVYWDMGDYNKALDYYNKAVALDEELNDDNGKAADMANIGNIYSQQGDTAKAMENYNKALNLYGVLGNTGNLAIVSGNIGEVYLKEKKTALAEKFLNTSLTLAEKADNLEEMKRDYQVLAGMYAEQHDWQKAYDCNLHYNTLKETLVNIENTRKIVREQMNYEFEKKQAAQQAETDKQKLLHDDERNRQRMITVLVAAIALIIALLALFIFRMLRATQREKLIIEQQKMLMELKALRAQMNPHFIFNAINSIQHFILKNDPEAAQKHLTKFSKLIRKVLENSRHESIPLSEEVAMLELYVELESVRFSSKFKYSFTMGNGVDADKIMISPLLLQPFIENAIWHGLMHLKNKQGELTVSFERLNGSLKCTIDDNGIGRMASQSMKSLGSSHQPMGLSITHERVQVLNEVYNTNIEIKVTDKTDEQGSPAGTRVEVLIPLNLN